MKIIELPFNVKRPILACGADMKGAFALAEGSKANLFEGFGDLADPANLTKYENSIRRQIKALKIEPEVIVCDLHPGYFSTQFAQAFTDRSRKSVLFKVQHHEAHAASAIVDSGIKGDVIGVAFDGTGYGLDGNIWGGEFFVGDLRQMKRAAHFEYIPMPGAEAAIREPWRMAVSYLYRIFGRKFLSLKIDLINRLDEKQAIALTAMIDKSINSPLTSSAGRFFDAVGSLVLSKEKAAFEAELPIELEKMALEFCRDKYDFGIESKKDGIIIKFSNTLRGIVKDLSLKADPLTISGKFHNTIADVISDVSMKLRKKYRINKVVLTGGVFQNKFLTGRAVELLKKQKFDVYTHLNVSTNDSGIPIGQIAIARARCV